MPHAPLIIVNPTAGAGRAGRLIPWLRQRLEQRPEVELQITRRAGEAESIASNAVREGHDRVIAVGGDGTVQEVINGLLGGPGVELGIVPVGSGNDLARSLGLPAEPAGAWKVAMGRHTRQVDAARARNGAGQERWFASAGGIGFDAQVAAAMVRRRGWQAGKAGYVLTTLTELRRFENRPVTITLDDETFSRSVLFVAIANGAYYGGGMKIAPEAEPDDGRLDVCVVGDISRRTGLREMPNLYRGTHVRNPAVSMHTARTIRMEGDAVTRIHLDGEPFGTLPLEVWIAPGVLSVSASPMRPAVTDPLR